MADLFDRLAPLRTTAEMTSHIYGVVRHFPIEERADTIIELIDRAERRGAIDAVQAKTLHETFATDPNVFPPT